MLYKLLSSAAVLLLPPCAASVGAPMPQASTGALETLQHLNSDVRNLQNEFQVSRKLQQQLIGSVPLTPNNGTDTTDDVEGITIVDTAAELQTAVSAGAVHIEIRQHLTLATLPAANLQPILNTLAATTKSIRGNCTEPVPRLLSLSLARDSRPLTDIKPGQCVILADWSVLEVTGTRVWLEGLYIRMVGSRQGSLVPIPELLALGTAVQSSEEVAEVYMTDITLQGDGPRGQRCEWCAVHARWASLHADGCLFADFTGRTVIHAESGASLAFRGTGFGGNAIVANPGGAAVIMQDTWNANLTVAENSARSEVLLEGCIFAMNAPSAIPQLLVDKRGIPSGVRAGRAVFYTDSEEPPVCEYEGANDTAPVPECPVDSSAKSLLDVREGEFLDPGDVWLVGVREELEDILAGVIPAPPIIPSAEAPMSGADAPIGTLGDVSAMAPSQARDSEAPLSTPATGDSGAGAGSESENGVGGNVFVEEGDPEVEDLPGGGSGDGLAGFPGQSAASTESNETGEEEDKRDRTVFIATMSAVAAGALMLILVALMLAAIVWRRRARGKEDTTRSKEIAKAWEDGDDQAATSLVFAAHGPHPSPLPQDTPSTHTTPSASLSSPHSSCHSRQASESPTHASSSHSGNQSSSQESSVEDLTDVSNSQQANRSLALGSASRSTPTHAQTTVSEFGNAAEPSWSPRKTPPQAIPGDNSIAACMRFIHQQLDCFGPDRLLLGRYQLLGKKERRTGGDGVIQFARRTQGSTVTPYAIKFFARYAAFKEEAAIYQKAPEALCNFMPAVVTYAPNDDGALRDPFGNVLPAFLCMERGESLADMRQSRRNRVDTQHATQVLANVSELIAELHEAGYVHRDLKPGNVLWLPRRSRWALVDFALTCRAGRRAPLGFTAPYAAPETLKASTEGKKHITADPAVDAWALGVIAYELLTGSAAFSSSQQAFDELADEYAPLPWDEGRITHTNRDRIGHLYGPICALLARNPRTRASARIFSRDLAAIAGIHTANSATSALASNENSLAQGDGDTSKEASRALADVTPPVGGSPMGVHSPTSSRSSSIMQCATAPAVIGVAAAAAAAAAGGSAAGNRRPSLEDHMPPPEVMDSINSEIQPAADGRTWAQLNRSNRRGTADSSSMHDAELSAAWGLAINAEHLPQAAMRRTATEPLSAESSVTLPNISPIPTESTPTAMLPQTALPLPRPLQPLPDPAPRPHSAPNMHAPHAQPHMPSSIPQPLPPYDPSTVDDGRPNSGVPNHSNHSQSPRRPPRSPLSGGAFASLPGDSAAVAVAAAAAAAVRGPTPNESFNFPQDPPSPSHVALMAQAQAQASSPMARNSDTHNTWIPMGAAVDIHSTARSEAVSPPASTVFSTVFSTVPTAPSSLGFPPRQPSGDMGTGGMRRLGTASGSSPRMRKLFVSEGSVGGNTPKSAKSDRSNQSSRNPFRENVVWKHNSSFVTCESDFSASSHTHDSGSNQMQL